MNTHHNTLYRTRSGPASAGDLRPGALAVAFVAALAPVPCAAEPSANDPPNVVTASALAAMPPDQPDDRQLTAAGREETPVAPPRWSSSAELSNGSYRWSASRGSFDVGMHFAAPSPAARSFEFRSETSGPIVSSLPSLSLGLRRTAPNQQPSASTLLERATGSGNSGAYVSRIGVEWKPAQPQVNFLREGLGIRLDGNDRMTVRLRKGMLGVYLHRKF